MSQSSASPGTSRTCPHCGAAQSVVAQFCTACGQPLAAYLRLRVLLPPALSQVIGLTAAPVQIGRLPDSSLRLDDPRISRAHARIAWDGGGFVLSDLGSSGGTFLNQVRLTAPAYLRPGDHIRLGDTVALCLECDAQPVGAVAVTTPTILATPAIPPASALPPASKSRRPARMSRGCGCTGALMLLVSLAALAVLALARSPVWPSQSGDLLGATPTTLPMDAAVPVLTPLPDVATEGPAINSTLRGLASALRAGDVAAASALFAPEVRDSYRELLAARPERLAAMAAPLDSAAVSFLSPYAAAGDGRRSAEVAVQVDGITFAIALVKVDGRWLIKTF